MGLFDGTGIDWSNMDSLALAGMAEALAQTSMPSRMPIPTGAVWGNLAGGMVRGIKAGHDLEKDKLDTELTRAKIPVLRQQMEIRKALLQELAGLTGGASANARSPQVGGAFPPSSGIVTDTPSDGADSGSDSLVAGGGLAKSTANALAGEYGPLIQSAASEHGIPPDIFARQIAQESSFNPRAVSPAGTLGIAQFMPDTAKRFGIDPLNPSQAIPAAAKYVARNRDMFGGNLGLALAGYNWGEGNVQKWLQSGANPAAMPGETRRYVANITGQPINAWLGGAGAAAPAAQAAPAFGSLAPAGAMVPQGPGGIDPLRLARLRELGALGGMAGLGQGLWDYYTGSPEFKARVRDAEKGVDLRYLPREKKIEQLSKYFGPEADPALQSRLVAEKARAEIDTKLRSAGIDPNSPEGQQAARNMMPDTRPEAVRLADAANMTPDARGQAIAGAIPGNAPTTAQKEMPILLNGSEAEKAALREAKRLGQPKTTINNVVDPITKGVGDSFVEQRSAAINAANSIRSIHQARELVDQGIFSGPAADQLAFFQRVGEIFNLPAETAANTAAFKAAIGEQVLSLVKGLGTGSGISNADREFAERVAGGQINFGETALRRILEIREKAERAKISAYSEQANRLLQNSPDGVRQIAPLLQVEQPAEYQPPKTRAGAASGRPSSGVTPSGIHWSVK